MFRLVLILAISTFSALCVAQDQEADPVAAKNSSAAPATAKAAALTPQQIEEQTKKGKEINNLITEAGLMFKRKAFPGSTKNIEKAKKLMGELVAQGDDELLKKLEYDYSRLETAQNLLGDQGQKLEPLPPLKEMGELAAKTEGGGSSQQVSFTKNVAPILMQRCGKCHVQGAKGGFSSASFAAIKKGSKKGQVLTVGEPANSSLFTMVESGKMPPRSRNPIPKQEIQTLKDWIAQGAKYDGANENDNLVKLVGGTANDGRDRRR